MMAATPPFEMPTRKAQHMDTQPNITRTTRTHEITTVGFTFPQLIELAFESLLESGDGMPNPIDGTVTLRLIGDGPGNGSGWSTVHGDFEIAQGEDGRYIVVWPTSGFPSDTVTAVSVTIHNER